MIAINSKTMFLALFVAMATLINNSDARTLKMVHLVYRHGARSSIHYYPNGKYQAKDWPDGAGRLTQKGMNMEYNLGQFLRKRYMNDVKFLNQTYLHNEVYIRSSDKERCLQSAETQLAGLYPPQGYQIWNKDIPWQPIPIHTVDRNDVLLRPNDIPCERLTQIWKEQKSDPEYIKMAIAHKGLLEKLSEHSGKVITPTNIVDIYDPTFCDMAEGFAIPDWLKPLVQKVNDYYNWLSIFQWTGDDELGRLLGGTLLGQMNKGMEGWKESKDGLFKMNIFSAHDSTLLSLATALDITIEFPNFSACIMVEMYEEDGQHFVEMYYRNTHTDVIDPIKLKKCAFSCPLHQFLELTKPRTTEDRSKICGVKTPTFITKFNLEVLVIGLAGLSLVLLLLLLNFVARKPVSGGSKYKLMNEPATI